MEKKYYILDTYASDESSEVHGPLTKEEVYEEIKRTIAVRGNKPNIGIKVLKEVKFDYTVDIKIDFKD